MTLLHIALFGRFGTGYTLMVKVGNVEPDQGQFSEVLVNPEVMQGRCQNKIYG